MSIYRHPNSITFEEFKAACEDSKSKIEVVQKLNLKPHKTCGERLKELSFKFDIALPNWTDRPFTKRLSQERTIWTPENIFVYGIHRRGQGLRKLMIKVGIPYVCSNSDCFLHKNVNWRGKPITLEVDHIDGDNINNVLSNLRFLCPNCHSQTDTFGSKNQNTEKCECGRRRSKNLKECPHGSYLDNSHYRDDAYSVCSCGSKKSYEATRCNRCANKQRTVQWIEDHASDYPSIEVMTKEIEEKGWLAYSKELGISDNGLRKVFRRLGVTDLPKKRPKR